MTETTATFIQLATLAALCLGLALIFWYWGRAQIFDGNREAALTRLEVGADLLWDFHDQYHTDARTIGLAEAAMFPDMREGTP